ncbi:MAG: hypothetical protein B7Z72_09170, partial [Gemmatimonadetes bacterium 21-71-4]
RLARMLVCEVEPWTALAARRAGHGRGPLTRAAWRALLLCHPHDTLCGCSIDAVARAMDGRLDDVRAQAVGLRDDAIGDLLGRDADAVRAVPDAWRPHLVLRNPAPRSRGGVAVVELTQLVRHVRVGPASAAGAAAPVVRRAPLRIDGVPGLQLLDREVAHERTEASRDDPYDDLVERSFAAVWVPEVPGYGLRALPLVEGRNTPSLPPNPVRVEDTAIANGRYELRVGADGLVTLTQQASGRRIDRLIAVEDRDDRGDLYTPSLRGPARPARFAGARIVHRGPLRGTIETRWQVRVRKGESAVLRVRLTLDADAHFLRLSVRGENAGRDHRLRLRLATDVANPDVFADAAFGPVRRLPLTVPPEDTVRETPPPTAPLHRYVSLSGERGGATVFSDGLAEYEAGDDGAVHLTLVRAVGELSRDDLPERPGHAGWPSPAPEAQCLGPFAAELAYLLHGAWSGETADLVERTADDVLAPIAGATIRSLTTV